MNKKLDQKGAVAIISVVVFSIIISVLITAYIRTAVTRQQESIDYDFSNRAFYAAESGVQDTIRGIKTDSSKLQDKDSCTPFQGSDTNFNAASFGLSYKCQLVTIAPASITGSVVPNKQSAMIKLEPTVVVANPKLVLRWSSQIQPGLDGTILYPREDNSKLFQPISKWILNDNQDQPIHPALKVSVFDHTSTASFTRGDINQRMTILNPTDSVNKDSSVNFKKSDNTVDVQQEQLFNNAECYQSDITPPSSADMQGYSCKQTIDLSGYSFSNLAVYVRIGSVYRPTDFSLELLDGSTPVQLNNSQAVIDVTGKAGTNTYRRLKQAVPLSNYQIQYGPDAALVSGEGICKQFALGTDTSVYAANTGCNPLTD